MVQDVQKVQGVQLRPIRLIRLIRGRKTKRGKTLYTQVAPVGRRTCGMLIPRVMLRSALGYVLATLSGCLLGNTMREQEGLFFVLHPLYVQDLILGVVGLEFGDYLFHLLHDGHLIEGFGDSVELSLVLESLFIGILRHLSNHDVGMGSGDGVLLAGQQLLIEFLTLTKAGIENLDVLGPREIYHPLGKVGNAHRLTHIEDIYLAPMSHGAGLENQSAGFGDEHEITYDVGVGDGDRTSLANLFLEDGNDRAIGAQDVTKSGGDELSYRQTTVKLTEFVGFKWFKRFNRFAWFKSYWYLVPLNSESLIVLMKLAIAIDSFLQSAYI